MDFRDEDKFDSKGYNEALKKSRQENGPKRELSSEEKRCYQDEKKSFRIIMQTIPSGKAIEIGPRNWIYFQINVKKWLGCSCSRF